MRVVLLVLASAPVALELRPPRLFSTFDALRSGGGITGSIISQTNRGFTGHEELDPVGLVHMNGRATRQASRARSDNGEPILYARVEPLLLRWQ